MFDSRYLIIALVLIVVAGFTDQFPRWVPPLSVGLAAAALTYAMLFEVM